MRTHWSRRVGIVLAESILLVIAGFVAIGIYRQTHEPIDATLGCVETVVTTSDAPTGPSQAQGGSIAFKDDIAPGHGTPNSQILAVYIPPGSYPVTSVGDRVRVCLLSVPTGGKQPGNCDPSVDVRGREFLVYDRANTTAAVYVNGEHGCGGA